MRKISRGTIKMYLQEILEVVAGLVFVWLVLSIGTMQIQEWLASIVNFRGNDLYKAIKKMLGNDDLADLFYDHPLIKGLSDSQNGKIRKPSYISANNFATTLINIILSSGTESSLILLRLYNLRRILGKIRSKQIRQNAEEHLNRLFEIARLSINAETGKPFGNLILVTLEKELIDFGKQFVEIDEDIQDLLKWVRLKKDQIDQLLTKSHAIQGELTKYQEILRGIIALSVINPNLNLILNSLLIGMDEPNREGEDFVQTIQIRIETWFNETMERLSGWYKRKTQFTTFTIGLILALFLNIDSIQVSNHLWREPTLRQAIVAHINDYAPSVIETDAPILTGSIEFIQQELMSLNIPVGWLFIESPSQQNCRFVPSSTDNFGILWQGRCIRPSTTQPMTNGWLWAITKLTGLLISGFAASQGSSFWFDILIKIVNVRTTGNKPQG
jgi:hypothetical protein